MKDTITEGEGEKHSSCTRLDSKEEFISTDENSSPINIDVNDKIENVIPEAA